jgi:hypothetical protein
LTNALDLVQQADCNLPFSYSCEVEKDSSPLPAVPLWFQFDSLSKKYTVDITQASDIGTYIIRSTVTIPQVDPMTGSDRSYTTSFTLTVSSDCVATTLLDYQVDNMYAYVGQNAFMQLLDFSDQISEDHMISGYCGSKTYTLSPDYPFLKVTGNILSLQSVDTTEVGTYSVSLIVTLTSFPDVLPLTKTFTASI